jgi:DNA-binding winged helix-turn-helix (wHTH) protein
MTTATLEVPRIDEDGLLRYDGRWVALSPKEDAVLRPLLHAGQRVVSRQRLTATGWPGAGQRTSALDKVVGRLRRRLEPLGLTIHTVRARGFVLAPLTKGLSWPT